MMANPIIRKNGIPLYVQVKNKIISDIREGVYRSGEQLPAERSLSETWGVSRNTISQAYQELEVDGVVSSRQGRGTFVADRDDKWRIANRRDLLTKVIDVALEESLQLGFSLDDFLELTIVRVRQKATMLTKAQIVFLECNREQVEYLSRKLEFGGVHIHPVVLDELRERDSPEWAAVHSADLIVTTFFHYDEVQELLDNSREVLAIALDSELETIVQIARIPLGMRVGLICRSENFAGKVTSALKQAGLDSLQIESFTTADAEALASFVDRLNVVVVSPGRRREVEAYCNKRQRVIEFVFKPDVASANLLRAAVANVRRR